MGDDACAATGEFRQHIVGDGFSFARLRSLRWIPFLKENMPKALIGLWGVWVPAVTIIYSLPASLQIPLFNVVLCFYALLFSTLNRGNAEA